MTRRLAVCITTLRRPDGLARLLDGIAACEMPPDISVEVRVVDNDPLQSGRETTARWAGIRGTPVPLRYEHEPRTGYVHGRNRAIGMGACDLLAFIDDDETPERVWLVRLVQHLDAAGADAAIGPVRAVLPEGAPGWLRRGGFRDAPCGAPGERAPWGTGRTGNVLFRGGWFYEKGFRFDPAFSSSGGEDADLFSRMDEAGARFVSSDATVWESSPAARNTLAFLMRRQTRCGANYARISGRRRDAHPRFVRVAYRTVHLLRIFLVALPPLVTGRAERLVEAILQVAFMVGFVPTLARTRRPAAGP